MRKKYKGYTDIERLSIEQYRERNRELQDPDEINFKVFLDTAAHQVRWCYFNTGKTRKVYDEKDVRLIVQKLQNKIKALKLLLDVHNIEIP